MLGPADQDQIAALFEQLSPPSRYLRYFVPLRSLCETIVRQFAVALRENPAILQLIRRLGWPVTVQAAGPEIELDLTLVEA